MKNNRLTCKKDDVYYPNDESWVSSDDGSNACRLLQVIGRYEEIEEQIGIDLIILFNALVNGFYIKYKKLDGYSYGFVRGGDQYLHLNVIDESIELAATKDKYYFKDYGKKWALTKEELNYIVWVD